MVLSSALGTSVQLQWCIIIFLNTISFVFIVCVNDSFRRFLCLFIKKLVNQKIYIQLISLSKTHILIYIKYNILLYKSIMSQYLYIIIYYRVLIFTVCGYVHVRKCSKLKQKNCVVVKPLFISDSTLNLIILSIFFFFVCQEALIYFRLKISCYNGCFFLNINLGNFTIG